MNIKRILSIFLTCLIALSALTACGDKKVTNSGKADKTKEEVAVVELLRNEKQVSVLPTQIGVDEDTSEKYLVNYEEVTRSENTILYADMQKGLFALQDIETEKIYYSTPNDSEVDEITKGISKQERRSQLLLYYVLKEEESTASFYRVDNSQVSCVAKESIEVKKITNGIRVVYSFEESGITVPVEYTLLEDGFNAKIDVKGIKEGKNAYLIGINLLPTFGAGNWAEEGNLFVPDGSGALIKFNGHKTMSMEYKFGLYSDEYAVMANTETKKLNKKSFHMPVFGVLKQDCGLMGIITEGDTSAEIYAIYGSGSNGYNSTSSVLNYRSIDSKTMFQGQPGIQRTMYRVSTTHYSADSYNVKYYMLKADKASYVGIAEKYRDYLTENKLLTKNEDLKPQFNLELYGAADISTSFLGINYSKTLKLTTFDGAQEILKALDSKGIKNIGVRYLGWTGDGILNKNMNTSASPLGKLGGKRDFDKLTKYADSISAELYPDIDLLAIRKNGKGYSVKNSAIHTIFNYPSEQYVYSKSVYNRLGEDIIYFLNGASVLNAAESFFENYKALNTDFVSLSRLGSTLYSDFAQDNDSYRNETAEKMLSALEKADSSSKKTAIDSANAYAFKYADKIWNSPMTSSGYDIYRTDVPFYQIVLHGYTSLTTSGIMQSQDPQVTFLKAVETGSELMFSGTYSETTDLIGSRHEGLYSTCYLNWIETAEEMYNRYNPLLEKVCQSAIIDHYEVSNGVFVTEYENGIKTAVNYGSSDYEINGITVKGLDFAVLEGDK